MPINTGAMLLVTLLPAAIFLTVNYFGDGTDLSSNSSFKTISKSNNNIFDEVLENDVKSSSVVKKSVNQEGLEEVKLPTCCDIKIRNEGGKQILSYCGIGIDSESFGSETVNGTWNVPKQLLHPEEDSKIFRLEKERPFCKSGRMIGTRSLTTETLGGVTSGSSVENDHFLSNGFLKFQNEYYRPDQYCINGFKDNNLEFHICKSDCGDPETPCVQKCCSYNEVYSLGMNGKRGGCLPLDKKTNETFWSPVFYEELNEKLSPGNVKKLKPHLIHKNPSSFKGLCTNRISTVYPFGSEVSDFLNKVLRRPFSHLEFQLRKDGWLMHPNSTSKEIAIMKNSRTINYCIDGVQNYGESEKFTNKESQTVLFVCTVPEKEETIDNVVFSSSMSVSNTVSTPKPTTTSIKSVETPSTSTTTTTSTTTSTTTTTTTTTTPRPVIIPKLPTCCHLDPTGSPGTKLNHYCVNIGNDKSNNSQTQTVEWIAAPKFMNENKIHKFKLEPHLLNCKENWTKAFIMNYENLPGGNPSLMANGMLKFQNEFFKQGEYCVNGIFSTIVEVLLCKTDCSSPETPCINKCCGPNEIYSLGVGGKKRGCIPLKPQDSPWDPQLYTDMSSPLETQDLTSIQPHLIQKFPPKFQYTCFKNLTLVFPYSKEVVPFMSPLAKTNLQFRLRKDGKIMYRHPVIKDASGKPMESVFNNVEYCVDGIRHYGEPDSEAPYQSRENQTVLFVCAMNPPSG